MFISLVIPVYNVRDYLPRCVNSVIKECSEFEYEVILVDDGSTDGCGDLCDDFVRNKQNFYVLHKSNGGLSDARNYGVAYTRGQYVFYLDSDDYLAEGGIKEMVEVAKQGNCDVICGNFYYQYSDYKTLFDAEIHDTIVYKGGEEALAALIEGKHYQNFAWGKLIRRELAQKFLFPKGKLFEDTYWFHKILHSANSVAVVEKPVVHYLQRNDSISFDFKLKSLDILDGYAERLIFFEQNYPKLVNKQKWLMVNNCIALAWMTCRYLNNKTDQASAIVKLREIISNCGLMENNLLLDSKQKRLLNLIMQNICLFKWMQIVEKIAGKFIKR